MAKEALCLERDLMGELLGRKELSWDDMRVAFSLIGTNYEMPLETIKEKFDFNDRKLKRIIKKLTELKIIELPEKK